MIGAMIWIALGFAALIGGAELLLAGGVRLAALARIPPILIGLTVVAVGTSTPELAVGVDAALLGSAGLVVGNIAGTNTFNILFIMGLSALIVPLALDMRTIHYHAPAMVGAALLLVVLGADGLLDRFDGIVMVGAGIGYTALVVHGARREMRQASVAPGQEIPAGGGVGELLLSLALLVAGIAIIVVGADWLVDGAVELARLLGVTDTLIGLTVVAIGTSAPELVTTVISTLRNQRSIAVGNLIGSGIYNICFILGVTVLVPPGGVAVEPLLLQVDLPVMAAAAIACLVALLTGRTMARWEGGLFVAAYLVYMTYLIVARG